MLIITIRTDKPEAEIGLYENTALLVADRWLAHRQLAETLHGRLRQLLETQGKQWRDVQGIAVFQGPGSFTGLRIGISVANALAYSLQVPVAGAEDPDWTDAAIDSLVRGEAGKLVVPEYGALPHITPQKK
ncbi:MAG TPA: tRNA (adenosine(37)-N6)-threonylcarbamoyltransferase complex dimerization subunit type 1 TsaB [Candidatus Saccharimonadales bacterium]|nr:tRNA (adenosine(37)-N6)-threonylcarbamoyltransferase complex dimerization subunit type 1 TsaB [Candidatus Saccharimonadales bacterium]